MTQKDQLNFTATLPGPVLKISRIRPPTLYEFVIEHLEKDQNNFLMSWLVAGGSDLYVVSVLKDPNKVEFFCTCPDAVYRQRYCKHIQAVSVFLINNFTGDKTKDIVI